MNTKSIKSYIIALKKRYLITLVLIAVIIPSGQYWSHYLLREHSIDMEVINIAGRQRMLSQKIAKSAYLVSHADSPNKFYEGIMELSNAVALWQESHMMLLGALKDRDLRHENSAKVIELYEIINPQYDIIREASELIINATSPKTDDSTFTNPNILKYVNNIFEAESKFLQGMDNIVLLYETEATARVTKLENIELLMMGILFSLLLVNEIMVFRPAFKKLISAEASRSMAEKNIIKLSRTVEQSPVTIIITDKNYIIEYVNPPFTKLTGYTSEEALGQNLNMLISKYQTKDFCEAIWARISSGKTWNGEIQNKKKNGELFWESLIISPIFDADNGIINYVMIKEDITEQKLAKNEFEKSEKKYRDLVENSNVGIYILQDNKFMFANETFEKILGHKFEEVSLDSFNFMDLVAPESKEFILQRSNSREKGENSDDNYFFKAITKTGKIVDLEANTFTIEFGGKPAIQGIIKDVTEQLQDRREKLILQEKLKQSERMESLGLLAGGVAHDLNNIIGPIMVYPDLIRRDLAKGKSVDKDLDTISSSVQRAADVISDLLALARRGKYNMETLDLNDLVNDYLSSAEYKATKGLHSEVSTEIELSKSTLLFKGSNAHLPNVIMNLINNAYESMPEGGVLSITTSSINVVDGELRDEDIPKGI
ncbi:MAG: PAS domain S-box protein [Candidatus Marinimicrobia bacterium]|nr:PAS domain S-box protein [Candidatus Neomarinimicrobiota bacterium]